jgi:hypothetical protein
MFDQLETKRIRHRFTRQVIVCWTEAAGEDNEVGALEGAREYLMQARPIVSDDRLSFQLDAHARELVGDEK